MLGIFDGDIDEGMMEAGQGSGLINDLPDVATLMKTIGARL
jgi:NAD(P)H-dependent flavin oxidoreductase YrpB (nitropropane dioxygenase family)